MLNDETRMLQQVPLFSGVPPAKLKLLAFTSERVFYLAEQTLFHQGDPADAAFVILSGQASVLVDSPQGPIQVAEINGNDIVGEIAILCDVTRTATVKAVTEVDALRISKENFLRMLTNSPEMTIEVIRVLADRLSKTTQELSEARSNALKGVH